MTMLHFGYKTSGLPKHRLDTAIATIADCGYQGVAIVVDNVHCNPFEITAPQLAKLRQLLDKKKLRLVVEMGAKFYLDPKKKAAASLVSADGRPLCLEFLRRTIDVAHDLNAECVSFHSGVYDPALTDPQAWDALVTGCQNLIEHSKRRGVQLAFEPEPEMLVSDMNGFERLKKQIPSARFGLTLDIAHVMCAERENFRLVFGKFASMVKNIHIADIKNRAHEHLMFGEGEIDFAPILKVLTDNRYNGLISVELYPNGRQATDTCKRAMEFLQQTCRKIAPVTVAQ
jgi:L-ribulose-5-phosphate 3-epimerase